MPLTPDIINFSGTTHQNIGQLFNYLISKGWTDAGTQTLSFYHGNYQNSNIQFRGIKNASGQIIYYNTTSFNIRYITTSNATILTAIINLSQNNTNNNFITSPNEFFNASCVLPTHTELTSNQITPAYIFYDTKNFILIIKNSTYSYQNNTNPTFMDYPNYYKILGYLELGTSGQYRVLFNDFVIPENKFPNYRNIVLWYNNQLYTNHIYSFNTLVSHDYTQAINNIRPSVYSQKKVKISYFEDIGSRTHTARVKLIVNDIPVANLPITVNKDLEASGGIRTINGQEAHIIPVYNFQDNMGNIKYVNLIIYPNQI
jgi:hypothetical protein